MIDGNQPADSVDRVGFLDPAEQLAEEKALKFAAPFCANAIEMCCAGSAFRRSGLAMMAANRRAKSGTRDSIWAAAPTA